MNLSPHFTLRELSRSETALRRGIDNTPSQGVIENLRALCVAVLEPLREHFSVVRISSGYRSPELNRLAGGSVSSQHVRGEAADLEIDGVDNLTAARWIAASLLPFDQLILEFYVPGDPTSGWIHLSHKATGNRRQVLTASRSGGAVHYSPGLP